MSSSNHFLTIEQSTELAKYCDGQAAVAQLLARQLQNFNTSRHKFDLFIQNLTSEVDMAKRNNSRNKRRKNLVENSSEVALFLIDLKTINYRSFLYTFLLFLPNEAVHQRDLMPLWMIGQRDFKRAMSYLNNDGYVAKQNDKTYSMPAVIYRSVLGHALNRSFLRSTNQTQLRQYLYSKFISRPGFLVNILKRKVEFRFKIYFCYLISNLPTCPVQPESLF